MIRSVDDWLSEYGESHRHPTNKLVHWICVPAILFSVLGLLWVLPVPAQLDVNPLPVNWAVITTILAMAYYLLLSPRLALGIFLVMATMLVLLAALEQSGVSVALVAMAIFIIAWAAQFWGHHVEGKRPSFFKDVQFLLIGPIWLLAHVYKRLGLRYQGGQRD